MNEYGLFEFYAELTTDEYNKVFTWISLLICVVSVVYCRISKFTSP